MRTRLKRLTSLFLALVMVFTLIPPVALAAGVNDSLVSSLAALYDGDEERAREELEALYEAGIIDENGNMVALDVREDGESVELSALAQRISAGETVGALTVNGHAATPEQIVQISRVGDLLELVRALDGDVEITDEHVANLEALLAGIADGSVNLSSAIERGSLTLASSGDAASTVVREDTVDATDGKYTQPMLDGSDYDADYQFALLDANNKAYYVDSRYNGVALDGTVTLACDKTTVNPGDTVTVTATLDKAQPLPVSFNWNASGAVLGDTVSGTVTWAAGEAGEKTFTVTAPAKASAEAPDGETEGAKAARLAGLWNGSCAFVISVGNLKNASFADDDNDDTTPLPSVWSKTVLVNANDKSAIEDTYTRVEATVGSNFQAITLSTTSSETAYLMCTETQSYPYRFPYVVSVTAPDTLTYTVYIIGCDSVSEIGNRKLKFDGDNTTDRVVCASLHGSNVHGSRDITVSTSGYNGRRNNARNKCSSPLIALRLPNNNWPSGSEVKIEVYYLLPPVNANVTGITVPAGTYYSGMTVPITVEFDQFVGVKTDTKLKVNNVECLPLDGTNTKTRRITFGYTVKDVDTGALNITELTGVKNEDGNDVNIGNSFESLTKKSFGADDGVFLASNVKQGSVDWDSAKFGVSKDGLGLTVMLPLNANKAWVVNEAVEFNPPGSHAAARSPQRHGHRVSAGRLLLL